MIYSKMIVVFVVAVGLSDFAAAETLDKIPDNLVDRNDLKSIVDYVRREAAVSFPSVKSPTLNPENASKENNVMWQLSSMCESLDITDLTSSYDRYEESVTSLAAR